MKKHVFSRRIAGALAVAMVATGALSLLTPPLKSDNLGLNRLFSNNSDFSMIAEASGVAKYTLTAADVIVSGNTITKFTPAFLANLAQEAANAANASKDLLIEFPEQLNGTDITKIGNEAFTKDTGETYPGLHNGNVKKKFKNIFSNLTPSVNIIIKLSDNIISIGEHAFESNSDVTNKITRVEFGTGLKTIGYRAFAFNESLKDVDFKKAISLETINEEAFLQDYSLWDSGNKPGLTGDLVLPDSITTLGDNAFACNDIFYVKLPDNIKSIGTDVFDCNSITSVNWGRYDAVENTVVDATSNLLCSGVAIPDGLFSNNKLESLDIPETVKEIGKDAFHNNNLKGELIIPANVNKIHYDAFNNSSDSEITLTFGKDNDGNYGIKSIGNGGFNNAGIKGEFIIPDSIEFLDSFAFAGNKITSVDFNGTAPEMMNNVFSSNPLISVKGMNIRNTDLSKASSLFNGDIYEANQTLKNVSFDYENLNPNFNSLYGSVFGSNSLRSIKIPKAIEHFEFVSSELPFTFNKGWYEGTESVALYRVDTDGTTYVLDNAIKDAVNTPFGIDYVFNPVLVEFSLKDKNGTEVSTLKPQSVDIERKIENVVSSSAVATVNPIDYEHYKLGDKLTFKLGAALPENYQLAVLVKNPDGTVASETALTPDPTGKYEVTLDPNNNQIVEEVSYGDGYEVGYKKTTFILKYTGSSSSGEPVVPYEPSTPSTPEQPATPSTPAQPATPANNTDNGNAPQINNNVDINDQNTPQGNTDIDDDSTPQGNTVIDDDTTPQGKAKTGTKVKADNSDKINIEDTKSPLGQLPRTGGSNDSYLVLLGGALIGLGIVVKRKIR